MNWIVGMDLRPRSAGAIQWASWLSKATGARGGEQFFPVHVLEDEHLRFVLRHHHLDEVTRSAEEAARTLVGGQEAPAAFAAPEIVVGGRAEDGLAAACRRLNAAAIVIGRAAKHEGHALVRLGSVARRILRALPAAVIVVPPDVQVGDFGSGPIVSLTALHDGEAAFRFAADLARRTQREPIVAHVVAPSEDPGYLPGPTWERIGRERREEAERALAEWSRSHALPSESTRVLEGPLLQTAFGLARELAAALLVVGSPGRSRSAWIPSFARELAASAPLPVAVVPD